MESKNEDWARRPGEWSQAGVHCTQIQATSSGWRVKCIAQKHSALPLTSVKGLLSVYLCPSLIDHGPVGNILFCACKKNIRVSKHAVFLLPILFFCKTCCLFQPAPWFPLIPPLPNSVLTSFIRISASCSSKEWHYRRVYSHSLRKSTSTELNHKKYARGCTT